MNEEAFERDLRRLHLLVMRAATDCGRSYPELRQLDDALRIENVDTSRLQSLLSLLEVRQPPGEARSECSIIRHDIAAELRELLSHH